MAIRLALVPVVVAGTWSSAFAQVSRASRWIDPMPTETGVLPLGGEEECDRNPRAPASLLLFPEFDNRFGKNTLLTITNVEEDLASGNIHVEVVYINEADCLEDNFPLTLTPGDTVTLLTKTQHPAQTRGYVYAFAKNSSGDAVSENSLIGQLVYLDGFGFGAMDWSVNAVGFRAHNGPGDETDEDEDGIRDLDGDEYDEAPERIDIPRFLGQDGFHRSTLTLINLSGGAQFSTIVDLGVYNDNEEFFSRQFAFDCWAKPYLEDISNVFGNGWLQGTNDNANEIIGDPSRESGWFWVDGRESFSSFHSVQDPAIYAFLVEDRFNERVADLPWEEGCQNNGGLLPVGPLGDPDP